MSYAAFLKEVERLEDVAAEEYSTPMVVMTTTSGHSIYKVSEIWTPYVEHQDSGYRAEAAEELDLTTNPFYWLKIAKGGSASFRWRDLFKTDMEMLSQYGWPEFKHVQADDIAVYLEDSGISSALLSLNRGDVVDSGKTAQPTSKWLVIDRIVWGDLEWESLAHWTASDEYKVWAAGYTSIEAAEEAGMVWGWREESEGKRTAMRKADYTAPDDDDDDSSNDPETSAINKIVTYSVIAAALGGAVAWLRS